MARRPKADPDINGVLVLDKPGRDPAAPAETRLLTSHDVVQRVRRWSGQRRIGHTGTLDPFASGVLVLCLGQATRLVEYYQGHDKAYDAVITLGVATDTYDVTGTVTEQAPIPPLDRTAIEAALNTLRGDIMQTPPAYSALKQDGEALYAKARRGEEVTVAARPVTIHAHTLTAWEPPATLRVQVHCSAGTYIRSLAHDLGRALGTAAHLAALRRVAAGAFTLRNAHRLDAVEAAATSGRIADLLLPVGAGIDLPAVVIDDDAARRLGYGQLVTLDDTAMGDGPAVARDRDGHCLGIVQRSDDLWKAAKWLAAQS